MKTLSALKAVDGAGTGAADGVATGAANGEGPANAHTTEELKQFAVNCVNQQCIAQHWVAA